MNPKDQKGFKELPYLERTKLLWQYRGRADLVNTIKRTPGFDLSIRNGINKATISIKRPSQAYKRIKADQSRGIFSIPWNLNKLEGSIDGLIPERFDTDIIHLFGLPRLERPRDRDSNVAVQSDILYYGGEVLVQSLALESPMAIGQLAGLTIILNDKEPIVVWKASDDYSNC